MYFSTHLGRLEIVFDLRWQTLGGVFLSVIGIFVFMSVFSPSRNPILRERGILSASAGLPARPFSSKLKISPTPLFPPSPPPPSEKVTTDASSTDLIRLTPPEKWQATEIQAVQEVAVSIGQKLADLINHDLMLHAQTGTVTPTRAFWLVFGGPVEFQRTGQSCSESRKARGIAHLPCGEAIWGETVSANLVLVYKEATPSKLVTHPRWFVHELGHAFSHTTGKQAERDVPESLLIRNTFAGPLNVWQYSSSVEQGEVFADLFLAWVFDTWGPTGNGKLFMDMFAPVWLGIAILD